MRLTVCIVTKGRGQFLEQLLNNLQFLIKDPLVDILILNNGAPTDVANSLNDWVRKNPLQTRIVNFKENSSCPSSYWSDIVANSNSWVIMPGDDDLLENEIIEAWRLALLKNTNLVAYSFSARLIDSDGDSRGELIRPPVLQSKGSLSQIAGAFHEPGFIWPALIFKISALKLKIPSSRYAFDWCVGLALLTAGEIESTSQVGLSYRVHESQESAIAPLRRKFFEGSFWIAKFIESAEFELWISRISDEDRLEFWNEIQACKPIYGDEYFGRNIEFLLAMILLDKTSEIEYRDSIINKLAFNNGVLLKDSESQNFIETTKLFTTSARGNLALKLPNGACSDLKDAAKLLKGGNNALVIHAVCQHSKPNRDLSYINCSDFKFNAQQVNADLIVDQLTQRLEFDGKFNFSLTGSEKLVIENLRKFKYRIPIHIKDLLRRVIRF